MTFQFKPAWWMRNRHAQTILPRFFRPKLDLPIRYESLTTPDDDFIELAIAEPTSNTQPVALVLHGLEGNFQSFYAKGMMKALKNAGLDVVLMHFRNCSRAPNKQARAYHSGETTDLRFVLESLKKRFTDRPIVAVGFSLGGNVLTKYLGECGKEAKDSLLQAACVVSAPFHLSTSSKVIRQSFGKVYQRYLLGRMKRSTERKLPQLEKALNLDGKSLKAINDLYQFDNQITAPLHGFKDAEDYYAKASSQAYLQHIPTPTLVIHAEDDPMLSYESVPRPHHINDKITLAVSPHGGHVGFITGSNPFKPVFWLEQAVPHYFKQKLGLA